jgi:hypothetical protein
MFSMIDQVWDKNISIYKYQIITNVSFFSSLQVCKWPAICPNLQGLKGQDKKFGNGASHINAYSKAKIEETMSWRIKMNNILLDVLEPVHV